MAQFVEVPVARLGDRVLQSLLGEFASRDGTDYGEHEYTLEQKIAQLHRQLQAGELMLLYDADCEEWDLLESDEARGLLAE